MTFSQSVTSDGKRVIILDNPSPGWGMTAWFLVKSADGTVSEHGRNGGFNKLHAEIIIDDSPNRFITPYPNTANGEVEVTVHVRNDWTGGTDDYVTTCGYTILENEYTRPSFDMSITPYDRLCGQYALGISSVQAAFSNITTKYGASHVSTTFTVAGKSYGSPYKSDKIATPGEVTLTGTVKDSRGFKREITQKINVYDYLLPSISAGTESQVLVKRAVMEDGNIVLSDTGDLLYINAKRGYSTLGGANKCTFKCIVKDYATGAKTHEAVLLSESDTSNLFSSVVNGVTVDTSKLYIIELSVVDTANGTNTLAKMLPNEKVYMDRSGTRSSIAFGGHVTEDNAFEVYQDAYYRGAMYIDDVGGGIRYKITIGTDGILRAERINTTYTLQRR